jgi:hypothetical protein
MYLSPIRATCPAHLSLLDFITRMIFGEELLRGVSWFKTEVSGLLIDPIFKDQAVQEMTRDFTFP